MASVRSRAIVGFDAVFGCFVVVAMMSTCSGGEDHSLRHVVEVLKMRERSIETLDVLVSKTPREAPDWYRCMEARYACTDAMIRFFGHKEKPKPVPPRDQMWLSPPSYFRYRRTASGHLRVDGLPDPKALDKFSSTLYFNGEVWQTYTPGERTPQVILDSPQTILTLFPLHLAAPAEQVLGIRGPLWAFGECPDPDLPSDLPLLSRYLEVMAASGLVSAPKEVADAELGKLVQIQIAHSMEKKYAGSSKPLYLLVTALLDPRRQFAPVRLSIVDAIKQGDRYEEGGEGQTFTVTWGGFWELQPGLWLPKKLEVRTFLSILIPRGGSYRPLLKDGKPVTIEGKLQMDYSHTDLEKFHTTQMDYEVLSLRVNAPLEDPLFFKDFPAGTVVLNRQTQELSQLTGVSPAIDAKLKEVLSGSAPEKPETLQPRPGAGRSIAAGLGVLAVVGLIVLVLGFRRRRRPPSEPPQAVGTPS